MEFDTTKLILISHPLCPYVQRAVIALKEKEGNYVRVDIDLNAKPDWFLALSPLGKTPVLLVNGKAIFESAVICEYLEETLQPSLHPPVPLARAQHRAWIEFASATLNAIWTLYTAKDEAVFQASQKTLIDHFMQIENAFQEGPYFGGNAFSLVDAAFGPVFRYFDVFDRVIDSDLFDMMPKIHLWRAALAQRPSVKTAVPDDYDRRLCQFVIAQNGILGRRLAAVLIAPDVIPGKKTA